MSLTYKPVLRRPLQSGNRPVHIRITYQRKQAYLATSIDLPEALWNEKADPLRANWVRTAHPHAKLFNHRIQALLDDVRQLALDGTPRTADAVKQAVGLKNGIGRGIAPATVVESMDFLQYFEQVIAKRAPTGNPRSVEKLACVLQKIRRFLAPPREAGQAKEAREAQLRAQRLPFAALTVSWVRSYKAHLQLLGNQDSTIHKDLTFINTVIREAVEDKWLAEQDNPFRKKWKLHDLPDTPKTTLNLTQVAALEALVLPPPVRDRHRYSMAQLAREVWLLQYYTLGSRIGDVLTLRWGAVAEESISFFEQKTNKQKVVPRHEQLNAVLARLAAWCPHQPPRPEDFVVPALQADKPYAQYPPGLDWRKFARDFTRRPTWQLLLKQIKAATALVNKGLKELGPQLGMGSELLKSHSARHSFANMGRLAGIPVAHMRDMLNHHSIIQTEVYFGAFKKGEVNEWALKLYQQSPVQPTTTQKRD